jgi:hypothetical protein
METERSAQTGIDEAIQSHPAFPAGRLIGWTLIAEWETPQGERKLARLASTDVTRWQVTGYLHQGLFTDRGEWADSPPSEGS